MFRCSIVHALISMLVASALPAQEEPAPKPNHWTNSTEFSVLVTQGNSNTTNFGLKNTLRKFWTESARFQLKLNGTLTETSDDRFRTFEAGLTWLPGETPPTDQPTVLIEPPRKPDNEIYLVEARYDRNIHDKLTWNAGASWDRNVDAGILNRTILFGGVGNVWYDREDLGFNTSYGLSYTSREEEAPDPEKDDVFPGFRFTWDYLNQWGKATTYENVWTVNVNLTDLKDYWFDMINKISVNINKHLALSVSLQWLYNNEPALEDIDLFAYTEIVDPDGIPGSGDEFFITTDPGQGAKIELGEVRERKKSLDQIFSTSLVIKF